MRTPLCRRVILTGRLILVSLIVGLLASAGDGLALPNLRPLAPTVDWDYPLVPRDDDTASLLICHVSATLPGNSAATYYSLGLFNDDDPTPEGFIVHQYLDGTHLIGFVYRGTSLPGNSGWYSVNNGPYTMDGGRHTLEMRIDTGEYVEESNELDNNYAHQYIWTPYELTHGITVIRDAPHDRTGGWSSLPGGDVPWYNVDGLRFESVGWWNAVVVRATDNADDYDCRLHEPSTGSENGFAANVGYSSRPAGFVDAVIVNRNQAGSQDWDVGVLNATGGESDYAAVWTWSAGFTYRDSITTSWTTDEYLKLYEFYLAPLDTGWVAVDVVADSPDQEFDFSWLDRDFSTGDMADASALAWTTGGEGRMYLHIEDSGYHGIMIYREPMDGGGACDVGLKIGPAMLDFVAYEPAGWHSPLVPLPTDSGTSGSVAMPDTLHGGELNTYPNLAFQNFSPVPYMEFTPSIKVYLHVDNTESTWFGFTRIEGWGDHYVNSPYPRRIAGGRHTLVMHIDYPDEFPELNEGNNGYSEQYCWSPLELPLGTTITRDAPDNNAAGIEHIPAGDPFWANCDGLRIPEGDGWWKAVALIPDGPTYGLALRLHDSLLGAKNGFAEFLAQSYWGLEYSEFVWVNFNLASNRPFDVGVQNPWLDGGEYTAEAVVSALVAEDPEGFYGPYTLAAGRILHLHEFGLEAGRHAFRLHNLSGVVDWGISLYPADLPYGGKSSYIPGTINYWRGSGEDEGFGVDITDPGYYCLAVWKLGLADLDLEGTYRIQIMQGVTAVSDEPGSQAMPERTVLNGAQPNPFNPRTTLTFELATADQVDLAIYDLQGRRLRTILRESLPAGRHQVVWDGKDNTGRDVATGSYLAVMAFREGRQSQKIMLLR